MMQEGRIHPRVATIAPGTPAIFKPTEVAELTASQMHLYLAFLFHRDYFRQPDSSLSCSFVQQGLFPPTEFIPILHFFATEIISTGQIHPCLAFLFHRDYFRQPDSSPSGSFVPQGLFQPAECISVGLFCTAGIISTDRMHPITGRPSLKTSLPGHSVKFQFAEHHPLSFQGEHP